MSVIPRWEFFRFLEMFWKAASPEPGRGNRFTKHYKESGFINGSCFSHPGLFCCRLSSALYPRCICKRLPSCCWAAHPRELRPAALDTTAPCQRPSLTFQNRDLGTSTLQFFSVGFVLQDAEAEQGVVWSTEDPRILHVYVETPAQL